MPHTTDSQFKQITVKKIGNTFTAEVFGVDFSKSVSQGVYEEVRTALAEYGVLVFRHADLDDQRQIAFSRMFGELDTAAPRVVPGKQHRLPAIELFDISNINEDGEIIQPGSKHHHINMVSTAFHCDLSYNPRRGGVSILRGAILPPPGFGGPTEFADTRTAYDELPADLRQLLDENNYIGCNNLISARLKTAPKDSPWVSPLDLDSIEFGRHAIVQTHERSGRKNLYITVHLDHLEYATPRSENFVPTARQPFEKVPKEESDAVIKRLLEFASQPRYISSVSWENENDLLIWDNTCVMHRTGKGNWVGKYVRDLRRCTTNDDSSQAYGFNERPDGKNLVWFPGVHRYMLAAA